MLIIMPRIWKKICWLLLNRQAGESNMIYSMTAFAREQSQGSWGVLTCEIRSINHRYLEVSLHMSEALRGFEGQMRELIRKMVKRGKIECSLRYRPALEADTAFVVNKQLAKELAIASEEIKAMLTNPAQVSASDILRFTILR